MVQRLVRLEEVTTDMRTFTVQVGSSIGCGQTVELGVESDSADESDLLELIKDSLFVASVAGGGLTYLNFEVDYTITGTVTVELADLDPEDHSEVDEVDELYINENFGDVIEEAIRDDVGHGDVEANIRDISAE